MLWKPLLSKENEAAKLCVNLEGHTISVSTTDRSMLLADGLLQTIGTMKDRLEK